MCLYCMIADWGRKWIPDPADTGSRPNNWPVVTTTIPWHKDQLTEFLELVKRVEEMEKKVDPCPCPEIEKLDYLKAIAERLDKIEKKLEEKNEK